MVIFCYPLGPRVGPSDCKAGTDWVKVQRVCLFSLCKAIRWPLRTLFWSLHLIRRIVLNFKLCFWVNIFNSCLEREKREACRMMLLYFQLSPPHCFLPLDPRPSGEKNQKAGCGGTGTLQPPVWHQCISYQPASAWAQQQTCPCAHVFSGQVQQLSALLIARTHEPGPAE